MEGLEVKKMAIVVKSAVAEVARKTNMRVAHDTYSALDKTVEALLAAAIKRSKANNRKTIMPADL